MTPISGLGRAPGYSIQANWMKTELLAHNLRRGAVLTTTKASSTEPLPTTARPFVSNLITGPTITLAPSF